jgi:Zn-dependent M32 family carboxypeptidase
MRSRSMWLGLLLGLLLFSLTYLADAEELPPWAAEMTELEAKVFLTECVTRLEATNNELKTVANALQNERRLRRDWQTFAENLVTVIDQRDKTIDERDGRLTATTSSLNEYEAAVDRTLRRTRWTGRIEGVLVGIILGGIAGLVI